jgi:butyrate kinase
MKIDKGTIDRVLKMDDEQLWKTIQYVAKRSGYERDGSFSTSKGEGWEMFDAGIATQTFCLAAHEKGKMVDIVSDDEGPFSPERSGRIPAKKVVDMCFSGKYTYKEMLKKIRGKGGIIAHLGTTDVREVESMIDSNEKAKLIYDAMAYQVAKGIGELATVLEGNVDVVILTGGIAYSNKLTEAIKNRVKFIAPVEILPGENELKSLAYGALRVLKNEEVAREYIENEGLAEA